MMNRCIYLFCWLCLACWLKPVSAEEQALLAIPEPGEKTLIHSDWYARKANEVKMDGNRLSAALWIKQDGYRPVCQARY